MPGDFIMSCRGTIGKLYQIPKGAPLGIIHPSLMKIRLKENGYDSTYFQFMLTKIIANESTNGNCVQMAITAKALGKKELPLPPLPLQRLFAQRIEQSSERNRRFRSPSRISKPCWLSACNTGSNRGCRSPCALKGQPLLAQGNALGIMAFSNAP